MQEDAARRRVDASALAASPRLFNNPVLEKLSRVHHLVPAILYLPVVAALLWSTVARLSLHVALLALLGGYLAWTMIEYFGHRFVFHLQLPGQLGTRFHFMIHGVHHAHPSDPLRLVMPPLMSLPILFLASAVLRAVYGPHLAVPALAGLLVGYVVYDTLHYHLHHGQARTRVGRELRRRHMLHHFHDDTRGFGISAPWWDDMLRTSAAGFSRSG